MLATLVVVFVLASFVGVEIISKVPQTLHTPLMSGSNAISGITIVGALVVAGMVDAPAARWLGFAALVMATINVVGGFLVTDRMLQMFRREARPVAPPAGAPALTLVVGLITWLLALVVSEVAARPAPKVYDHFVDAPANAIMVVKGLREHWVPLTPRHLRKVTKTQ